MDITDIPILQKNQTNMIQMEFQSSALQKTPVSTFLHFRPYQHAIITQYGPLKKDNYMQSVTIKVDDFLAHVIKKLSGKPNKLN